VCWVSLTGNPTLRELNRSMLAFFAHPGSGRGTTNQFVQRALDCVLECEVKLLVIDDLHFLRFPSTNSIQVSNHFKYIANCFPVTLVFIGVGLTDTGLLYEGKSLDHTLAHLDAGSSARRTSSNNAILAQTARRTTPLGMAPFRVDTSAGRDQWRQLLKSTEQRLVLINNGRGMLADELPAYLYERTTGHIGSLMTLISRGCARAIRDGTEDLTKDLLDEVKLDAAAEAARPETAAALRSGKFWRQRQ
jgi:hypothetical protein